MAVSSDEEVCRDFQKGNCNRGNKCKFSHPKLEVCRDFQTKGCSRSNCKFQHISHNQQMFFESSGNLPSAVSDVSVASNILNGSDLSGLYGKRLRADSLSLMSGLSPLPKKAFMESDKTNDLCRDFEKGNCSRGQRCKYFHPKLRICRDFQNEKCERETCRFLHLTKEEEDSYESSGKIPEHIDEGVAKKNRIIDLPSAGSMINSNILAGLGLSAPTSRNEMLAGQICHDFEKGNCNRASRCKYFHPMLNVCRDFQNNKCEREACRFLHISREEENSYNSSGQIPDHIDEALVKRNKIMNIPSSRSAESTSGLISKGIDFLPNISAVPQSVLQENEILKQKIIELQQQISELHQMNDTLYQQNMTYRQENRGSGI